MSGDGFGDGERMDEYVDYEEGLLEDHEHAEATASLPTTQRTVQHEGPSQLGAYHATGPDVPRHTMGLGAESQLGAVPGS